VHTIFFDQLKRRLERPLPGEPAQQKMASSTRLYYGAKAVPDARTRKSAVLLLLYPEGDRIYVPMILRPVYKGVHSGQVGLPGGRMDETDASLEATALREAWEEIGVIPEQVTILGRLSPLFIPVSNFMVHPLVGAADARPDFAPNVLEVAQLLEVPLDDLRDAARIGEKDIPVGELSIRAPYFDLQGQTVWGATA
jgi:8-oxo-dGTP pyrophosphatase MutT (NUDIX family)